MKNNKRILWISLVILLLLGGTYYAMNDKSGCRITVDGKVVDKPCPELNLSDSISVNMQNYKQVIGDLISSGQMPNVCEKITYSPDDVFWSAQEVKPKDICYKDFAVARKDTSICDNTFYKKNCVEEVNNSKK
jgi:type 1 fimbria pilin